MLGYIGLLLVVIITTVDGNVSTVGQSNTITCDKTGIKFVKKGCYGDPGGKGRTLPLIMVNDRHAITWKDWNNFIDKFSCKCAEKVVEGGFRYFGLQFYGECWSGDHAEHLFARESKKCIGHNYESCDDNTLGACTGGAGNNYVYEIVREETLKMTGRDMQRRGYRTRVRVGLRAGLGINE